MFYILWLLQIGIRVFDAHLTDEQRSSIRNLFPDTFGKQQSQTTEDLKRRAPSKQALDILRGAKLQR